MFDDAGDDAARGRGGPHPDDPNLTGRGPIERYPTNQLPTVGRPPSPAITGQFPVISSRLYQGDGQGSGDAPRTPGAAGVGIGSATSFDDVDSRRQLRRLEQGAVPGARWSTFLKVGTFLVLIVAGIWFVARLRSVDSDHDNSAFGGPDGPIVNPTVDELAQATVQIVGLDANGQPLCSGSGTFVSTDGLVLTNAHVVTSDAICDFASLGIAVTDDAGRPPQLLYRADLVVTDDVVDLAVLRVSGSFDPNRPPPVTFPSLALGNSDDLGIGDDLRILGYPEIGGETITFTNGSVSGFTAQAGLGDRALIKTDATIAGGNSGGAAVDAEGRLIGIPTKARASESGPAVDCRPLADTNGDGNVDEGDNCVPIGGFLNGIRPIGLAAHLIERAREAPVEPVIEQERPTVPVDSSTVVMSRPRFSNGENENTPAEVIVTASAGLGELCLFVDWSGIPDGAEWDGIWWYDGEIVSEYSLVEQVWEFGETGSNFWMCAIDDQNGLEPGLYELGFFLDGQLIFAEGIVLTEEPVPVYPTTWQNVSDIEVCSLAINPDGSGQVGLNELADGERIAPGGTVTIGLPAGAAVVQARDCDGEALADSAGTLLIEEGRTYTIEQPVPEG